MTIIKIIIHNNLLLKSTGEAEYEYIYMIVNVQTTFCSLTLTAQSQDIKD